MTNNPGGWPSELWEVVQRFATCEYSTLTMKGAPITFPLTPYLGEKGLTIDVSTGLSYPAKAERARRNPKVGILLSDPVGSGMEDAPVVLVYALATVRDTDLQAGSDRYIRLNKAKFPEAYKGQPVFLLKRQQWYYTRIWMYNTPIKAMVWPNGNTDKEPEIVWNAPAGTVAPPSDPAPAGAKPNPWNSSLSNWQEGAVYVLKTHGAPILTVVDRESGFPVPFRTKNATLSQQGFLLEVPAGMPASPVGPACLTFHSHPEVFVSQENTAFVGEAVLIEGSGLEFRVERQLGDFSLGKNKLNTTLNFMRASVKLNSHLKAELARRGQKMPVINVPKE